MPVHVLFVQEELTTKSVHILRFPVERCVTGPGPFSRLGCRADAFVSRRTLLGLPGSLCSVFGPTSRPIVESYARQTRLMPPWPSSTRIS